MKAQPGAKCISVMSFKKRWATAFNQQIISYMKHGLAANLNGGGRTPAAPLLATRPSGTSSKNREATRDFSSLNEARAPAWSARLENFLGTSGPDKMIGIHKITAEIKFQRPNPKLFKFLSICVPCCLLTPFSVMLGWSPFSF